MWKNTASAARRHGVSCIGPSIPSRGETLASELTTNGEGDTSQIGPLLEQISGPITSVTAEGAHGGELACQAEAARQLDSPRAGFIPPRSTLVPSPGGDTIPSLCDQHFLLIEDKGRIGRQRKRRLRPAIVREQQYPAAETSPVGVFAPGPRLPKMPGPRTPARCLTGCLTLAYSCRNVCAESVSGRHSIVAFESHINAASDPSCLN